MPYITVPSVLHSNERAYKLHRNSSDNYHCRGNSPLLTEITMFETYGDGTTQHSPDLCPQFHELTDVCLSFATAILADPTKEEWRWLTHLLQSWSSATLDFAFSVKFKEGRHQYYSISEQKVTSSDRMRHDKRYYDVESWHDGTTLSAFVIITRQFGGARHDCLPLVRLAVLLHDRAWDLGIYTPRVEDIWTPIKELKKCGNTQWHSAYHSFYSAVRAVAEMESAQSSINCLTHNLKNEADAKAKAEETNTVTQ